MILFARASQIVTNSDVPYINIKQFENDHLK